MALSMGDILQITDVQQSVQQTLLNVYFFRVTLLEANTNYDDVNQAFDSGIITPALPIQSVMTTHVNVIIKNLTNGLDIAEYPHSEVGLATGDSLPTFNAAAFRLVRSTAATRHGAKRIGSLSEGSSQDNSATPAFLSLATAFAAALGSEIQVDGTVDHDFSAEPVIVGRYPQDHPNAGELDLSVINPVASAQFVRITSQVSRRAGRGV